MQIDRRSFLFGVGAAGAGFLASRALGAARVAAPADGAAFADTLRALGVSLTPFQRERIVFPADHPSRQINNTLAIVKGPHLGTLLSPSQQVLVRDLFDATLSERGRDAFAGTIAVEGRFPGCVLAIYGEPTTGDAQVVVSGGHLLVRGGGTEAGAPFGGGIAYGHQIGNEQWRVPGNAFAYHGDALNAFVAKLAPSERAVAILPAPPHELLLQVQGAGASFPGVAIGALGEASRDGARELLDTIFSAYPESQRRAAFASIEGNGGIDALHVAVYASHGFYEDMKAWDAVSREERAARGEPYWQVWRIEGPGTVIHFKGHPHVHAYISMARDPVRANVGDALGAIDQPIEGDALRDLLEAALRRATGESLAFHGADVPGRFPPGPITTGLAWSLDPYANRVAVATIEGREMSFGLRQRLAANGVKAPLGDRLRFATTDYYARQEEFGRAHAVEVGDLLLRDALVEHLRAGSLG